MPSRRDKDKTQQQLIKELTDLRQRIVELERADTERKKEALRGTKEELKTIFDEIRYGIALLDLTGKVTSINKRITEFSGYAEKDVVGKRLKRLKMFPPQNIPPMLTAFAQVMSGQLLSPYEVELYTKTGEKRIVEIDGTLLGKGGKTERVIAVMRDVTARKQAEGALRESEKRYRTLVDNIDLGINLIDVDHTIIMVNAAHSRDFKRPISEVIGKKCFQEFEKRAAVCPHCPGSRTITTGRPAEAETEGVRDDGSRFNVRLQTFPVFGRDGKVTAFIEIAEDISERKRMEEELRESERKYRAILETMEEGYAEVDLGGNFTFCNKALCRIHGRSRDEMMGMNNREYMTPETAKRIYGIFNKVYRTGIPAKIVDNEIIRKDGSIVIVEESASLLHNAAGEPIGFYGVSRDRTEQKKAEEALRRSEEKYRTILEDMEESYYEVDLAGNFTFFNDSLCRIYGYTRDELMEMNNRAYMSPETAKKTYRLFNKVYKTGEPNKIFDWEFIKKDGRAINVEISVSLMKDSQGNAVGFRGILRDITERKRAEEALRESEERYRTLIDNIDLGIALIDVYHNIIMVNAAQSAKFNKPVREIIGKKCFREFEKRDAVCPHCPGVQTMATNQPAEAETEGVRDDGSRFQVRLQTFPVFGRDGKVTAFIETAVDISKRKRMEDELRESERRYRTILETMEEGYYELDLAGNFTFFNEAECRIHGRSREELMGINNREYTTPETAKRIYAIFNKVYKTGIPAKIVDYRVIRKDDSVAMIETSASLLRNAAGEPIGFYGISRDRTEQKKAEEILRQSEEKYRTILENMEEGYYEVDLVGNLTFFNDSLCRIHGYTRDEMMGMNNREYMDEEASKRVYKIFNTVFRTGKGATIQDWQIIRKDGFKRVDVEASVSLMRDAGGNPLGFRGVVRDVTVRKQAEEALRESEEKYRSLVEFTEDSVYLVNRQKQYLFMNEKYLARLGLSRDLVIGRPYGEFHSREDDEEFFGHIEQVLKTGRFVQYEHRSQTDGRYFLRTLSPVRQPDGHIEAVTVIAKDITERKRAEEKFEYMATHDSLTGLPNRTLFNDRLSLALAQAHRNKKRLAVMLLDLDYFKDINDTMGHSMGDQLLGVVGNRLTELLRGGDTVARAGGDEFLLLLSEIASIKDATTIAQKILAAFRKPFVINDHEIMITTSIGIAIYPDDSDDASTLMKHADVAMYRAKDKGRDNFQRYKPS
ncbi:MAG: PAS domain S-box protein [Desulfobacterales bacterium]|nr:PAS domain S-box protein [Desulfobacterales bacterium]